MFDRVQKGIYTLRDSQECLPPGKMTSWLAALNALADSSRRRARCLAVQT